MHGIPTRNPDCASCKQDAEVPLDHRIIIALHSAYCACRMGYSPRGVAAAALYLNDRLFVEFDAVDAKAREAPARTHDPQCFAALVHAHRLIGKWIDEFELGVKSDD